MQLDQEARDIANVALAKIEKHEAVCAERVKASEAWRDNTTETLVNIARSISRLYSRAWMAVSGLIGILLGIIGWLITHPHAGF